VGAPRPAGSERTIASQFDAATYDIVQFYCLCDARDQGDRRGAPRSPAERTAIRDALRAMKNFPSIEGADLVRRPTAMR